MVGAWSIFQKKQADHVENMVKICKNYLTMVRTWSFFFLSIMVRAWSFSAKKYFPPCPEHGHFSLKKIDPVTTMVYLFFILYYFLTVH
jgi:hypothetical protein